MNGRSPAVVRDYIEALDPDAEGIETQKEPTEIGRTFGRFLPTHGFEAERLLRHLRAMGIAAGQEIRFEYRGRIEYRAILTEVEPFDRPHERLKGEIRHGFLLHFRDGVKVP
jgi:hypothetical protein